LEKNTLGEITFKRVKEWKYKKKVKRITILNAMGDNHLNTSRMITTEIRHGKL
jgi:hypothetical protein